MTKLTAEELAKLLDPRELTEGGIKGAKRGNDGSSASAERERVFDAFRRWGYLEASLDPLGFLEPLKSPDLNFSGADADAARAIYSATIGADFMHLLQPERRRPGLLAELRRLADRIARDPGRKDDGLQARVSLRGDHPAPGQCPELLCRTDG